jgi:hypothetical protein
MADSAAYHTMIAGGAASTGISHVMPATMARRTGPVTQGCRPGDRGQGSGATADGGPAGGGFRTGVLFVRNLYNAPAQNTVFWTPPPGDPGPAYMFNGTIYNRGAMTLLAERESGMELERFFEAWLYHRHGGRAGSRIRNLGWWTGFRRGLRSGST